MTDTSVKVFQSTDSGAGGVSGQAGSMIAMIFDKCLVSGYGEVTLDSLVVADNVATGTKNAHGFTALGSVGPVIRIAGASPAGLNGDWRVTITSATAFTFATSGIADQTATGTIIAKRAPAGFSKAFSDTNKAAYRADAVNSTRLYLQIDDSTTTAALAKGYETMSAVNSGSGSFPSTARYFVKSSAASAAARPWILIADDRLFYLCVNTDNAGLWASAAAGDIQPYHSADEFNYWICAPNGAGQGSTQLHTLNSVTGSDLARLSTQAGSSVGAARYSHGKSASSIGFIGNAYPNPVDNCFHAWPIELWETTVSARGMVPGLWNPIHPSTNLPSGTLITDIPQLPGRTLLIQRLYGDTYNGYYYNGAFDIVGPWR